MGLTIGDTIKSISDKYKNKTAIIFDDIHVSYAEMYMTTTVLANSFQKLGISKNDKVAIILPNCIEYIYSYFALFSIGAWAVPISTRWEKDEVKNVLIDSDVTTIIYQENIDLINYTEMLTEISDSIPLIKRFIVHKSKDSSKQSIVSLLTNEKMNESFNGIDSNGISPDDVALLAYTSGTTGHPKGVMISHKTLVLTSDYTGKCWFDENDRLFSIAPLYSAQGFLAMLIDLVSGVSMKWLSTFNPRDILAELSKGDATAFHTQPTMWHILMAQSYFDLLKFNHLKKVIVSGSLCSFELAKRIEERMNCKLLNAYGLIEGTGVVTITTPDDPKEMRLRTVGKPIQGAEVKIVNNERKPVGKGEIGELAVRGYNMIGYYKQKEKTDEVIDGDGWLYTGDLACSVEDEYVAIVGRCKDMIIRGGFNVYPIDIEECLLTCEKIDDVAVVGKEDEIMGEAIVAFVIPKVDHEITKKEVIAYCRQKIANYKIPDEVIFVSQFPILLSGKIQKNVLKDWLNVGVPLENKIMFSN
jgi:fatty-acyl-CoA synthase